MLKHLVVFYLLVNTASAATIKLGDLLTSATAVKEILGKHDIQGSDAKQLHGHITTSLASLGIKNSDLSSKELNQTLNKLLVTRADIDRKKNLQNLLEIPENKIQKEDLMGSINDIIYLAARYGNSIIISCAECVNDNLAKNGLKYTIETIKNAKTSKLLNDVIPKTPVKLHKFISKRMKSLGMGDYSKVTTATVLPEDEKSLALFLSLAESGPSDQKALIESIRKVSTVNGKVNIINSSDPHKFWRILADDMTSKDIAGWINTLEEVSIRAHKDNLKVEESFFRILKEKARGNEYLLKQYEALKAKRCFFR